MSYNHLNRSSSVLALAMVVTFRIPQITHHSAVVFRMVCSTFYFPHFAIPYFTDTHSVLVILNVGLVVTDVEWMCRCLNL